MVRLVLEYLANDDGITEVLTAYPAVCQVDVLACLAFAATVAKTRIIPLEVEPRALQA